MAMGALTLVGGALAIVTAILPPEAEGSDALIVAAGAALALLGLTALWRRPRLGELSLGAAGLLGTALITLTTYEGGASGGTADNELLYLWVILYAFYFLSLPNALIQTLAIGAAYAWLLTRQPDLPADQATTQWLVTMTTLVSAGLIVARVRANLYELVDELSERATHDSLTGLLNRDALKDRFGTERSRANRERAPVSVLAVDIDGLKALNDGFGHPRGDEVLKKVAGVLESRTRHHDAVARIGGDEFAVVLSGASEAAAGVVAEDIRATIASEMARDGGGITVSVGVTTGRDPIPSLKELLGRADRAMYAGKREGGDSVRSSDLPKLPAPVESP